MQTHNLVQGSPEWHAFRAEHFGASEAPAMMGCSPYVKRNELLREKATGLKREIDAVTQSLFDNGHRFEALDRMRAEEMIGDDLFPVVGSRGKLSASFDGIVFSRVVTWEHKSLNDEIRAATSGADLPLYLRVQMEHQLHVSEAEKTLFSASHWDADGNLIEEVTHWYFPDLELRQQILAGWAQFDIELAAYQHVEVVEPAKAAPIADLPAVTVQVRGELTMCNLDTVTPLFDKFLSSAITTMQTDEDFALAKEQSKKAREAAEKCRLTAKAVVDQMATVAEVTRTLEQYADKFDALGLLQEKAVKQQNDAIRAAAKLKRDQDYANHIAALNDEIAPLRLVLTDADKPNFVEVMKNQRTLVSLYNKLDTELARVKIAADAVASQIRGKMVWYRVEADGFQHLFADLQNVIAKPLDDFKLVITTRIAAHKAAEAKRQDDERAKIAAEEKAKAEAAAAEKLRQELAAEEARRQQVDAENARIEAARVAAEIEEAEAAKQGAARAEAVLSASQKQREAETLTPWPAPQASLLSAVSPTPTPAAADNGATVNIGWINDRLNGVSIDAKFLERKGFLPVQGGGSAKRYPASQLSAIREAIYRHVEAADFVLHKAAA